MPPKPRYSEGEKVLCYHGPLLYEAKSLKWQFKDKILYYFIHYSGWNKNWDEWVPESRVLKFNDTNIQKQKELEKIYVKTKKSKKSARKEKEKEKEAEKEKESAGSSNEKPTKNKRTKGQNDKNTHSDKVAKVSSESRTETKVLSPKKKKLRFELSFEEEPAPEVEYKLPLPKCLKEWLLDDWDLINRQKKLIDLPAKITVDHIVANYVKHRVHHKNLPQPEEKAIISSANCLRDAFNALLGKLLLYKFERPQYADMFLEYRGTSMSQLYGASHLLRMFTKLSELLKETNSSGDKMDGAIVHLADFIKFVSTSNVFNARDYVVASPEYHRRAL